MDCAFLYIADMTFTHEGNKTFIDNLVNFEKMVRSIYSKGKYFNTLERWGLGSLWYPQLVEILGWFGIWFLKNIAYTVMMHKKVLECQPCVATHHPETWYSGNCLSAFHTSIREEAERDMWIWSYSGHDDRGGGQGAVRELSECQSVQSCKKSRIPDHL